jgi:hypothetical protein
MKGMQPRCPRSPAHENFTSLVSVQAAIRGPASVRFPR